MKKRYWIGTGVAAALLIIMSCIISYFKGNLPDVYEQNETTFNVVIWCIVGLWGLWQLVNVVLAIISKHKKKS